MRSAIQFKCSSQRMKNSSLCYKANLLKLNINHHNRNYCSTSRHKSSLFPYRIIDSAAQKANTKAVEKKCALSSSCRSELGCYLGILQQRFYKARLRDAHCCRVQINVSSVFSGKRNKFKLNWLVFLKIVEKKKTGTFFAQGLK